MKRPSFLIRSLKPGDLEYLADHLRNADKQELAAASGHSNFLSRLSVSAELSDSLKVVEAEGVPLLIFGTAAITRDTKAVWLVGTKRINAFSRAMVEEARQVLRNWFEDDTGLLRLMNFTYAKNKLHHRWLEALGAEIMPAEPLGTRGALFHPFEIRRKAYV
ncbi:hypothetical protein GH983_21325 [Agrobacterium sp. MA01]|uniref:hypothetical protein n=1 Tax=Agrobacterium sp. MA01 TaxID=2664893 RepID=UPI00129AD2C3|nr:hypothetical protein [Agrobacterium sp. MA01]QGG92856.1 hypothetical protein GH983_21325 [Agrobacterium sp. MA01]